MRIFLLIALTFQLMACGLHIGPENAVLTQEDLNHLPAWQSDNLEDAVSATSLFTLFDSPQLRMLVDEALAANPDLQQAALNLQIVQVELRQAKGDQIPLVDADLSMGKEEASEELYTGALSVSWTLDIWGKLRDITRAGDMEVNEKRALLQAARNDLVAEVMGYWLQLVATSHDIGLQTRRVETLLKTENYILSRYRSGLGDLQDLDSARSATSSARATLVEYQETRKRLQRTLQILLGKTTVLTIDLPENYPVVLTPLVEVPEQTLGRRPDLKAAYYAIRSADLKTSVAYKELLPEINLSAVLEDIGDSPSSLLLADPLWTLLGDLAAPLFHGGTLRAEAEIAELEAAQTYQVYRQTLLSAIGEVENGLAYEQELSQRIVLVESALKSARNSLATYRNSYRAGLVDILDLLSVQKATYDLEFELDDLVYNKLANRIQLGLALGLGVTEL